MARIPQAPCRSALLMHRELRDEVMVRISASENIIVSTITGEVAWSDAAMPLGTHLARIKQLLAAAVIEEAA